MSFTLRGAFIEFMPTALKFVQIPNVIIFQFNPDTMTHSWAQAEAGETGSNKVKANPMVVASRPNETFTFKLSFDANESIANDQQPFAGLSTASGVYPRLAALEMLLHPTSSTAESSGGLMGMVTAAIADAAGGSRKTTGEKSVPENSLNIVLFVWGPYRVVPVRVTKLEITELEYDFLLTPRRATVDIGLKALSLEDVEQAADWMKPVAVGAVHVAHGLREALAIANAIYSTESAIGMFGS